MQQVRASCRHLLSSLSSKSPLLNNVATFWKVLITSRSRCSTNRSENRQLVHSEVHHLLPRWTMTNLLINFFAQLSEMPNYPMKLQPPIGIHVNWHNLPCQSMSPLWNHLVVWRALEYSHQLMQLPHQELHHAPSSRSSDHKEPGRHSVDTIIDLSLSNILMS